MLFSMMSIGLRGMQKSNFQRTSTTILVCNIHNQDKMSLVVFLMRYRIDGDELCLKEENKYRLLKKKRAVRSLSSFDYLMGIDDFSRMGGFRFKKRIGRGIYQCFSFAQDTPID